MEKKVSEVLVILTTLDALMVEKCLQVKVSGMDLEEGFSLVGLCRCQSHGADGEGVLSPWIFLEKCH